MAYKLQLPEESKIHPVSHVSQLKLALGSIIVNSTVPPQLSANLAMEVAPEKLPSIRSNAPTSTNPTEVLIKWEHLPPYNATWEDFRAVSTRFPAFHPP